jgi:putative membrane protein
VASSGAAPRAIKPEGGEDPKLKDWAGKTLPALKHHLEMAQALDKNRK